jgi:hypothetical protein
MVDKEAIQRALRADHPIEAGWEIYRSVLPPEATEAQLWCMRQSFFHGARFVMMMGGVIGQLPEPYQTHAATKTQNAMAAEIEQFCDETDKQGKTVQ